MKRPSTNLDTTRWTLAKGMHDGHPLLVRFRQFDVSFDRAEFPERLNVFWAMSEPDDNGLASETEVAALQRFEDDLVALVEADPVAVLAIVLTCNGTREFVFHARDVPRVLDCLNEMPQDVEPFPIKIQRHCDSSWAYFDAVVGDVQTTD